MAKATAGGRDVLKDKTLKSAIWDRPSFQLVKHNLKKQMRSSSSSMYYTTMDMQ